MLSKVTVWHMTEEERLAYIEKHPIIPTKKTVVGAGWDKDYKDVSWRSEKANAASPKTGRPKRGD